MRSTKVKDCSGWNRAGCRVPSCTPAGDSGSIQMTFTPTAGIAAGSTNGGSRRRPTPTTDQARLPMKASATSGSRTGRGFLLKEAVEQAGDLMLGKQTMEREKGWNLLCKFFDNMGPIPHHMHQSDEHAKRVGRRGKPEAYYFPPQYNPTDNNYPYTFMGLEPGTTKQDVRRCLENWNKGDNGITYLSRAYRLERGSGWQIDPGILHAPGSLLTYEPQVNSDVFAMFQSEVEGRITPWDLLVKDVPADKHKDLDYIVEMLDWEANVNPRFGESNRYRPKPVKPFAESESEGYREQWVTYGPPGTPRRN
jgi:hypothetical protein